MLSLRKEESAEYRTAISWYGCTLPAGNPTLGRKSISPKVRCQFPHIWRMVLPYVDDTGCFPYKYVTVAQFIHLKNRHRHVRYVVLSGGIWSYIRPIEYVYSVQYSTTSVPSTVTSAGQNDENPH